jgi:hypothetical protein
MRDDKRNATAGPLNSEHVPSLGHNALLSRYHAIVPGAIVAAGRVRLMQATKDFAVLK